ncbi:glycosyltransferase [Halomonas sp.]|uniref:glycosyltransferase n=1 Tax=Halomonas sp. TaxID=1486246 RepID=UPI00356837E3
MATSIERPLIALLSRGITGGGVQHMMLNLARELVYYGYRVDLLVREENHGDTMAVPDGVRLEVLTRSSRWQAHLLAMRADPKGIMSMARPVLLPITPASVLTYLPALRHYLVHERPSALIAATTYLNVAAVWAVALANTQTRLVLSERDNLSTSIFAADKRRKWRWRFVPSLVRRAYSRADAVVSVSDGVGDDLAQVTGLARQAITTIYNPAVTLDLAKRCAAPVTHPWFISSGPPVVLAAGRLVEKKDYATLLRAIAIARRHRDMRLIILGDGPEHGHLEQLCRELAITDIVDMPGYQANPHAYLARAAVFALSSRREGFPNVLLEALACGCPVVSTDCPSGPAEALASGKFGKLVPVGDASALAEALLQTLQAPMNRESLQARAAQFTLARTAKRYLELLCLDTGQTETT